MFGFGAGDVTQVERKRAINNTAELYKAIAEDVAEKLGRNSYADVLGVKKIVGDNLKLYFQKLSLHCYFVDEAIEGCYNGDMKVRFGRELMDAPNKMVFQEVVRAEAALVEAVKKLHEEIDEICKKRQKEFPGKLGAKRKELRDAANADAKLIAYSALEIVGNIATVIGIVGVVLSVMFPSLALAAAGAGITSGIVTLSAGASALSFAVPAATAVVGYAMAGIGMINKLNIESDINVKMEDAKSNILKPELLENLQNDLADKIGNSELIRLGVIQFAKQKGKEGASAQL